MMELKPSVMIDIETMGRRPGCAIWQIAAVRFGPEGVERDGAFHACVELRACVDAGLTLEPETVHWWMEQGGYPQFNRPPWEDSLIDALRYFVCWMRGGIHGEKDATQGGRWVWANSPAFDLEILAAAFAVDRPTGREEWEALVPWWNQRDFRTLRKVLPWLDGPERLEPSRHDALADAIWQAEWVVEAYQAMQSTADLMQVLMREAAKDGWEVPTLEGASGGWRTAAPATPVAADAARATHGKVDGL